MIAVLHRILFAIALGVVAAALFGCSSSQNETPGIHVEPTATSEAPIEVERVATIGSPTSSVLLGKPTDVAVDGAGRVYVVDRSYSVVRVLSPEGDSLDTIGKRGHGPGEFVHPTRVFIGPNDSLVVSGGPSGRVSVFGPAPERAFEYAFHANSDEGRKVAAVYPTGSDEFLARYVRPYGPMEESAGAWLVALNREGEILEDSLAQRPALEMHYDVAENGHVQSVVRPFARKPLFEAHPDGRVCHAWTGVVNVACTSSSGSTASLAAFSHTPRPVTPSDRQRYESAFPAEASALVAEKGWHKTFPAFEGLAVARNGDLWIREADRRVSDTSMVPRYRLDVEQDTYAEVSLPYDHRIEAATDTYVYANVFPQQPNLVVYRVHSAPN